jgi:hypothetical protein
MMMHRLTLTQFSERKASEFLQIWTQCSERKSSRVPTDLGVVIHSDIFGCNIFLGLLIGLLTKQEKVDDREDS